MSNKICLLSYERRDKKCPKSYRKGNETEGKKERGGVPLLCDLIYHFLPVPLRPPILISLLFLEHIKRTSTSGLFTFVLPGKLFPQISMFAPSLSSDLCLNITLLETHLLIFIGAYLLVFPWPHYRKSQRSLSSWSILFLSLVLTSTWYIPISLCTACQSMYRPSLASRCTSWGWGLLPFCSMMSPWNLEPALAHSRYSVSIYGMNQWKCGRTLDKRAESPLPTWEDAEYCLQRLLHTCNGGDQHRKRNTRATCTHTPHKPTEGEKGAYMEWYAYIPISQSYNAIV